MKIFNLPSTFTNLAKGSPIFQNGTECSTELSIPFGSISTLPKTVKSDTKPFRKLIIGLRANLINAFSGLDTPLFPFPYINTALRGSGNSNYKKKIFLMLIPGHHSRQCPLQEVEKLKIAPQLTVRIPAGSGTV